MKIMCLRNKIFAQSTYTLIKVDNIGTLIWMEVLKNDVLSVKYSYHTINVTFWMWHCLFQ